MDGGVRRGTGTRPGRIVLAIIGGLLALVAFGTGVGGAVLVWAHTTQRDDAGFYTADLDQLRTDTYALVSERLDFGTRIGDNDWTPFDEQEGDLRFRAAHPDGDPIFIGAGRTPDVLRYLDDVAYDQVRGAGNRFSGTDYRRVGGQARPETAPGEQDFWLASTSGEGRQTLLWDVDPGPLTIVVMNEDGSSGVAVDASIGARTDLLLPLGIGLLGFAAVVGLIGIGMIIGAAAWGGALYDHAIPEAAVDNAHPVRLNGHLDLELSRWMWLVKWFLAIPHFIVLGLLWPVAFVATLIAAVAILFTGQYPKAIFDLNVGVMRWTWRVTFYALALGTDRYPPFSLAPDSSYPADLSIDYPARLSRGLVLVKWLLAFPHYIVLAVFGGLGAAAWQWDDGRFNIGGAGVAGLLVFAAAVVLLFSGRYPQQIFDVVMGMQRWAYRVYAYTGLMTDEYPPFRFDGGGADPGSLPVRPPSGPEVPSETTDLTTTGG